MTFVSWGEHKPTNITGPHPPFDTERKALVRLLCLSTAYDRDSDSDVGAGPVMENGFVVIETTSQV
jgi:hypothetical protein